VPIRADGRSQSGPRKPTIPFPPKRPESPPVLPGHADVIVKLIEQRTRLAVSTRGEQGWEEDVLDALIISWVEVKELMVVADRFVRLAQLLQSLRQPETGTPIGPGPDHAPEMPRMFLKGQRSQRTLPGP